MSNRRYLLTSIFSVSFLVLIIILATIIYLVEAKEKINLETNTTAWANSLAHTSVNYLLDNDNNAPRELNTLLKQIITPSFINYIHIYKIDNADVTQYFTGFNKSMYYPSIADKIDQIALLSTLQYQTDYAELIVNIMHNEQTIGYLYIQSSTKHITDYRRLLYFTGVLLLLLGLALALLLAVVIQRRISKPIATIVGALQTIAQKKDYQARIQSLPIIELDILARNINILLARTEKYLQKKDENHQQALQQNNHLAEKLQARTDALKESNQELLLTLEKLHQFQGQLVETEKMASLGDMVAGIAHEVNTPIGLGITASTLLSDSHSEIKQAFENKTLKSSQLKKFLIQGEENIAIIYRNLERSAQLISSFKKVAVDQSTADNRVFNVKELIEEVMLTLQAKLNEEQVVITIDCPENLVIESKPGPINQILINLILNSIIHGFEHKPAGAINISVMHLSDQLHLCYQDDGEGMDENIKAKVFEPFTTTKRGSGGSGLGLHLVYNLVNQALNGHIEFESSAGQGTTFNVTFPVFLVP